MENRWPAVAPQLHQAIAQYRQTGYVASYGDWHPDVNAIAVPLVMPDGEIYSLNCGGPAFKLPPETLAGEVAPRLMACVRAIMAEPGATLPPQSSRSIGRAPWRERVLKDGEYSGE